MILSLANVLPYLALAGLALEATPAAASSHDMARHPRAHKHPRARHVAGRRSSVGAAAKPQFMIRKRADGSKCRVRPTSTDTATAPPPATTDASNSDSSDVNNNLNADTQGQEGQQEQQDQPQDQPQQQQQEQPPQDNQQQNQDQSQNQTQDNTQTQDNNTQNQEPTTTATAEESKPTDNVQTGGGNSNPAAGSGKMGLPWINGDYNEIGNFIQGKVSWYYTWGEGPVSLEAAGRIEYVPQLWGWQKVGRWSDTLAQVGPTAHNALWLNEPDHTEQANIHPYAAMEIYEKYREIRNYNPNVLLGSASPTQSWPKDEWDPKGKAWTKMFYDHCIGAGKGADFCTPDFYALHFYSHDPNELNQFIDEFLAYQGAPGNGKQVWITEFGCHSWANGNEACDAGKTDWFNTELIKIMDANPKVARYAPYGVLNNVDANMDSAKLMNGNTPTDLFNKMASW